MTDTFEKKIPTAEKERDHESKESKEMDPELLAAARMERADYLVEGVKTSSQQMKGILLHMGQVQKAIKQIRQQLNIQMNGDDSSVEQDKQRVAQLQKQIVTYKDELIAMQGELISAHAQDILSKHPNMLPNDATRLAKEAVEKMVQMTEDVDHGA